MYDDDKPPSAAATWTWFGWFWSLVIGSVVVIALIVAGFWFFDTDTSGIKGKGDVIRQNNDGTNRISAQATFNTVYGDIQTDLGNIKDDVATNPGDAFAQQTLTSDREKCRSDINKYNGYANDTTMKDWRPDNLPASIDTSTCEDPK